MPIVDEDLAISLSVRCSIELYQRIAQFAADCAPGITVSEAVRLLLDVGEQELRGGVSLLENSSNGGAAHS